MGAAILNSVSEFCSVTTEFNRDGEIAVRGKGACLCVSLGNVLGPPRQMDIKTQQLPFWCLRGPIWEGRRYTSPTRESSCVYIRIVRRLCVIGNVEELPLPPRGVARTLFLGGGAARASLLFGVALRAGPPFFIHKAIYLTTKETL